MCRVGVYFQIYYSVMRKLLILFCLCCTVVVRGQVIDVQRVEGELNVGLGTSVGNFQDGKHRIGPDLGLELRYNIPQSKFDVGLLANLTTSVFDFDSRPGFDGQWDLTQSNRSVNLMLVGDYNFNQGSRVNPYVGLGLGASFYDVVEDKVYPQSGTGFIFRPRVGIELFHHLRIGAFLSVIRTGYTNFGISIGGVIGGRPRK